jgi:hypothetical protein
MNTNRALKGILPLLGVLILCCVCYEYGLAHPARTKARAQRIGSVNAAPRIVMSLTLSNIVSPNVQNQEWGKRYADYTR